MRFKPKQIYQLKEFLFIVAVTLVSVRILVLFHYLDKMKPDDEFSYLHFTKYILLNTIAGTIGGCCIAFFEIVLFPRFFQNFSYLRRVFFKTIIYILQVSTVYPFVVFLKLTYIDKIEIEQSVHQIIIIYSDAWFWATLFLLLVIVGGINFLRDVYRLIGPNILWYRVLGRYSKPIEERRIFMFLDLKSSTTIAEKLGHLKYSSLLQDCFKEISDCAINHHARIYQYVGDEAVLTWNMKRCENAQNALNLFFSFSEILFRKHDYFNQKYAVQPVFKAALHCGLVTVAEVGLAKKEIAYHGDVVNTSARLQGLCNTFEKQLLASEDFVLLLVGKKNFSFAQLSEIQLKGKHNKIKVFSISKHNNFLAAN